MVKSLVQSIKNIIFVPIRFAGFTSADPIMQRLGLKSLKDERLDAVLAYVRGRLLDIGCGKNELIKYYEEAGGEGVGVDVFEYEGVYRKETVLLVEDSANLPFENQSFDTIVLAATLNHIVNRVEVLREAIRILADDGQIIITMIDPIIGLFIHKVLELRKVGIDVERGMAEGELYGMWKSQLLDIASKAGLMCVQHEHFLYRLNNIFLFKKAASK